MTSNETDLWMVRTSQNEIVGPFSRSQLQGMVKEGALSPQDEIARGNHYWMYLHERQEVLEHLGVEPPVVINRKRGEEDTQTDTETETLVSEPEIPTIDAPEITAVLTRPSLKTDRKHLSPPARSSVEIVGGEIERASYWKLLAAVGVIAIVFLVAGAIRILWTN